MEFIVHLRRVLFWCPCPLVDQVIWFFLIVVSFNSSRLFFFILVLSSSLSFPIMGFCDSLQFFILSSQLFHTSYESLNLLRGLFRVHLTLQVSFSHLGEMTWMTSIPTALNWWCKKSVVELPVFVDGQSLVDYAFDVIPVIRFEMGWNTPVLCLPKTLRWLS